MNHGVGANQAAQLCTQKNTYSKRELGSQHSALQAACSATSYGQTLRECRLNERLIRVAFVNG